MPFVLFCVGTKITVQYDGTNRYCNIFMDGMTGEGGTARGAALSSTIDNNFSPFMTEQEGGERLFLIFFRTCN
jgi:hypothetical protein